MQVLVDEILPALKGKLLKRGERTIRIISAGCSSGEEVYTLAILLMESGHFTWGWDLEITGVDIDPLIVEKARTGIYNGRSFQTTSPHIIDRYFTKCDGGLMVKDILRKTTSFVNGNLLQFERAFDLQSVDIIFCRNVLIYFGDDTIKRIVANFHQVLKSEGLLFLGHSESLSRITSTYLPLRFPGAIVYKKRE